MSDWNKITKSNPAQGVLVDVKFKNGKIIKGKLEGNFWVFDPKDLTIDMMMSKPVEWK